MHVKNYDFKYEHKTHHLCSINHPISLNNRFNKLPVKLFALEQHQIHLSIAVMSSSSSTVFWFSLYDICKHSEHMTQNLTNIGFGLKKLRQDSNAPPPHQEGLYFK